MMRVHLVRLMTAVCFSLLVVFALCGCGDSREGNRPEPQTGVGETLVSIGLYFTWAGSAALGLGLLGVVACFVFPVLAGFREFLGDIAVVGLASLLLGTSFIWLGNNPWVMAVCVALLVGLLAYRYRTRLARLLRLKKGPAKPLTCPPAPTPT